MKTLLFMFPRIWQIENRVVGADLGLGKFQFDFENEEDITKVLNIEPFHFDHWMVAMVRWEPSVDPEYLSMITFWIRVLGIPLQFWAEPTFRSIGEDLGKVEEIDIHGGRVKVILNGLKPLCFATELDFGNGVEIPVKLRYERLFGFCSLCYSLCHDEDECEKQIIKRVQPTASGGDRPKPSEEDRDRRHHNYKGAVESQKRNLDKGKGGENEKRGEGSRVKSGHYHGEPSYRARRFTSYSQLNDHRRVIYDEETKEETIVEPSEVGLDRNSSKLVRKSLFQDSTVVPANSVARVEASMESVTLSPGPVLEAVNTAELISGEEAVLLEQLIIPEQQSIANVPLASIDEDSGYDEVFQDPSVVFGAGLECGELGRVLTHEVLLGEEENEDSGQEIETDGGDDDLEQVEKLDHEDKGLERSRRVRGPVLAGAGSKKRLAQMMSTPRKRQAPKQGDGGTTKAREMDKGGHGGSKPPKPHIAK
ncbi:uncharacterized protein LOC111830928 [Capsella rubella]|uniref:uncharacterized protein LOC111830928 n=1 Tax=Capsella rubella TaxID=81985 RepID=UPI000CD5A782|nr:uncharacterized protein LOC111830928 [Capsella rubella]